MKTLSIREVRQNLGRLDQLLEKEREIIISRRGRSIARVLPIRPARRMPSHAEIRAEMSELSDSARLIREDREAR